MNWICVNRWLVSRCPHREIGHPTPLVTPRKDLLWNGGQWWHLLNKALEHEHRFLFSHISDGNVGSTTSRGSRSGATPEPDYWKRCKNKPYVRGCLAAQTIQSNMTTAWTPKGLERDKQTNATAHGWARMIRTSLASPRNSIRTFLCETTILKTRKIIPCWICGKNLTFTLPFAY